jgi:hypothetical protein
MISQSITSKGFRVLLAATALTAGIAATARAADDCGPRCTVNPDPIYRVPTTGGGGGTIAPGPGGNTNKPGGGGIGGVGVGAGDGGSGDGMCDFARDPYCKKF